MTEPTPLTDADLSEIEARLQAATPGPWHWHMSSGPESDDCPAWSYRAPYLYGPQHDDDDPDMYLSQLPEHGYILHDSGWLEYNWSLDLKGPNAELIAHAPTDIARLLAEVKRLQVYERAVQTPLVQAALLGSATGPWRLSGRDDA